MVNLKMKLLIFLLFLLVVSFEAHARVKVTESILPCRSGRCLCDLTRPECYLDGIYVCKAVVIIGLIGGIGNETISCYLDTSTPASSCETLMNELACGR